MTKKENIKKKKKVVATITFKDGSAKQVELGCYKENGKLIPYIK